ncbi:MAG TPA: hypothetical protein VLA19_25075, partial [Herpetosiphonaceae bacterium]|nr:hypothetical protein [Herpetosiphonaceae bacterium]
LRAWFVLRWRVAVTFEEARRHLGVKTQRQWSALAIRHPTPALLGLCSLVTLWAHPWMGPTGASVRQTAWYHKHRPTCSDARALVRRALWAQTAFCMSARDPDVVAVPRAFVERLTDALCYAA